MKRNYKNILDLPKIGGVYRINFSDGQFYIGCSINLKYRVMAHVCRIKNGYSDSYYEHIKGSYIKSVRILHFSDIRKELRSLETKEINKQKKNSLFLNFKSPSKDWTGLTMSDRIRLRAENAAFIC